MKKVLFVVCLSVGMFAIAMDAGAAGGSDRNQQIRVGLCKIMKQVKCRYIERHKSRFESGDLENVAQAWVEEETTKADGKTQYQCDMEAAFDKHRRDMYPDLSDTDFYLVKLNSVAYAVRNHPAPDSFLTFYTQIYAKQ